MLPGHGRSHAAQLQYGVALDVQGGVLHLLLLLLVLVVRQEGG